MECLLGWLERWAGLPLTRETAKQEAARQISESLTATLREVARRIEEETKKPPRPAP